MIRAGLMGLALALTSAGIAWGEDRVGDTDRAFVETVSQQCLFASRLAGAASSQASSPEIKSQAPSLAAQHLATCAKLKRIADKWQIGTPGTMETSFSEAYDKTVGLSGQPFDQAYRTAMMKADAAQAAAAGAEGATGENPDLRAFAAGDLATDLHRELAPVAGAK